MNINSSAKKLLPLAVVLLVCVAGLVTVAYAYNATYSETIQPQEVAVSGSNSYITITSNGLSNPSGVKVDVTATYGETSTTGTTTTYTLSNKTFTFKDSNDAVLTSDMLIYDQDNNVLSVKIGKVTVTNNAKVSYVTISADSFTQNLGQYISIFEGDLKTSDITFVGDSISSGRIDFGSASSVELDVWVQAPMNNRFVPSDVSDSTNMVSSGYACIPGFSMLVLKATDIAFQGSDISQAQGNVTVLTSATDTTDSTNSIPVTIAFSDLPSEASTVSATYTKTDANTLSLSVSLLNSESNAVSLTSGTTATVTFTVNGFYDGLIYYDSESSDATQPSDVVYKYIYGSDGTVKTTTITFTTDHFSKFVAYSGDSFPVGSIEDLQAALNAKVPVIGVYKSISTGNSNTAVTLKYPVTIKGLSSNVSVSNYVFLLSAASGTISFKDISLSSTMNGTPSKSPIDTQLTSPVIIRADSHSSQTSYETWNSSVLLDHVTFTVSADSNATMNSIAPVDLRYFAGTDVSYIGKNDIIIQDCTFISNIGDRDVKYCAVNVGGAKNLVFKNNTVTGFSKGLYLFPNVDTEISGNTWNMYATAGKTNLNYAIALDQYWGVANNYSNLWDSLKVEDANGSVKWGKYTNNEFTKVENVTGVYNLAILDTINKTLDPSFSVLETVMNTDLVQDWAGSSISAPTGSFTVTKHLTVGPGVTFNLSSNDGIVNSKDTVLTVSSDATLTVREGAVLDVQSTSGYHTTDKNTSGTAIYSTLLVYGTLDVYGTVMDSYANGVICTGNTDNTDSVGTIRLESGSVYKFPLGSNSGYATFTPFGTGAATMHVGHMNEGFPIEIVSGSVALAGKSMTAGNVTVDKDASLSIQSCTESINGLTSNTSVTLNGTLTINGRATIETGNTVIVNDKASITIGESALVTVNGILSAVEGYKLQSADSENGSSSDMAQTPGTIKGYKKITVASSS